MTENPYQTPVSNAIEPQKPSSWARVTRVVVCIGVVGGFVSIGGMTTIALADGNLTREIAGMCLFAIGNVVAVASLLAVVMIGAVRSLVVFRSNRRARVAARA